MLYYYQGEEMTLDNIVLTILAIVSLLIFRKLCKGGSCDYKTRIRVYVAMYAKEICFVDTKRKEVVTHIKMLCDEYVGYAEKDFKIITKYMSKLTYSLMREL